MPNEYSNFTTPDDPNAITDHRTDVNGNPIIAGKDQNYHPEDSRGFSFNDPGGGQYNAGNGPGKNNDPLAYGGYDSTWEIGPDGVPKQNYGMSGANAAVGRYQGKAEGSQGRAAVQNDYGVANQYGQKNVEARARQTDAMAMQRNQALNGNAQSQHLGQKMLRQGADTQVAAALSSSNDPLAQSSALNTQRGGVASYMQKGNSALAAQKADDMAAGRVGYMNTATGVRSGDAALQNQYQSQAINQSHNEMAQRGANDSRERGYENLAFGVNSQQQAGDIKDAQINNGVYTNNSALNAVDAQRNGQNQAWAIGQVADAYGNATKPDPNKPDPQENA
jgi:hypothetical protein